MTTTSTGPRWPAVGRHMTRMRRDNPHYFYAIDPPMGDRARRRDGRIRPVIECCERELFELEGAGHDEWCPTQ